MKKKEEEYELLPYGEINKLRKEISQLKNKKNLSQESDFSNNVKDLSRSINKLINIFEIATQFVKEDENEVEKTKTNEKETFKQISKLNSHLNKILEENSLIAQVIVKLNDSITDLQGMFSEFDKNLKTILKRTYIRTPIATKDFIPSSTKTKSELLQQYKKEFSQ